MHEVLVNRLGGLSLPRKSVVRLTGRPDMTLDVYRGSKTTIQQQQSYCLHDVLTLSAVNKSNHLRAHLFTIQYSTSSKLKIDVNRQYR